MFDFLKIKKKSLKPENKHTLLISQLNRIQSNKGMSIFNPINSTNIIRVTYKSIQEFNQFLNKIINISNLPKNIVPQYFQVPITHMLLKDWFISQNGLYLKPEEELEQFKKKSVELLEIYIDFEDTGSEETLKACSILAPLINQISEISNQLMIVTMTEMSKKLGSAIKDSGF